MRGRLISYPNAFTLRYPNGDVEVLYAVDALDRKTVEPIPGGGIARGRLFWTFSDMQLGAMKTPGTKIIFGVSDVNGKRYTRSGMFTGRKDNRLLSFPGMQPQPVPQGGTGELKRQ